MLRIIGLGLALVLSAPLLADEAYDFDKTVGGCPRTSFRPIMSCGCAPISRRSRSRVAKRVRLEFRSPSATIESDSADQTVRDVRFDGKPIGQVISDNARQLTTVTLPAPCRGPACAELQLQRHPRDDARGLDFRSPTVGPMARPPNPLQRLFEPTDARLMFLCWDGRLSGALSAQYDCSADWAAISNMPIRRRVVHGATPSSTFERSPKMPTYLVHLTTGDFARITTRSRGTELGVWAIRGQEQDGKQALANARQILADYDDYFDYPFPLPKLDSLRSLVALTAAWRTGAPSPTPISGS